MLSLRSGRCQLFFEKVDEALLRTSHDDHAGSVADKTADFHGYPKLAAIAQFIGKPNYNFGEPIHGEAKLWRCLPKLSLF
jgi:hypothetical protein